MHIKRQSKMSEVDEMEQIENHMVVGPDSFDDVVECEHDELTHGETEEVCNTEISFHITCDSCGEEGYVVYKPKPRKMAEVIRPTFEIEVVW